MVLLSVYNNHFHLWKNIQLVEGDQYLAVVKVFQMYRSGLLTILSKNGEKTPTYSKVLTNFIT
jgi:hypothetical protein